MFAHSAGLQVCPRLAYRSRSRRCGAVSRCRGAICQLHPTIPQTPSAFNSAVPSGPSMPSALTVVPSARDRGLLEATHAALGEHLESGGGDGDLKGRQEGRVEPKWGRSRFRSEPFGTFPPVASSTPEIRRHRFGPRNNGWHFGGNPTNHKQRSENPADRAQRVAPISRVGGIRRTTRFGGLCRRYAGQVTQTLHHRGTLLLTERRNLLP